MLYADGLQPLSSHDDDLTLFARRDTDIVNP